MAKKPAPASEQTHSEIKDQKPPFLPWPQHPKELGASPRLFRIHRLDSFAWQAYVTNEDGELPIGKPDVFEILSNKVRAIMRLEGQADYLAKRTAQAKAESDAAKAKAEAARAE